LLFTPDLLHFWLTGRKANELSIASTSQFYNPGAREYAADLLGRLRIPTHFLQDIVDPGAPLGPLDSSVATECGVQDVQVITPAGHDTGCAVAAAPAESTDGWAYISCGTWSLVGVESPEPVITERTLAYNLTNEGGVNGTTRLLRNVMGLWLLQQCRRSWERVGRKYGYDELAALARDAVPFATLVDPDDPTFLNPPDMPEAISSFAQRTGQPPPDGVAATVRCIEESLALKYRWVIERLEDVTGKPIEVIHVIGGGCRNRGLCQAAADATGRIVMAGPVEATAAGNIVIQAITLGELGSLEDGRAVIRRSFPVEEYRPRDSGVWDSAYERFLGLLPA
jgi:rhamnulokinase